MIISHSGAIWMLYAAALGVNEKEAIDLLGERRSDLLDLNTRNSFIDNAQIKILISSPCLTTATILLTFIGRI